ncbi:MAG TPA: hypothetical protein VH643_22265 [Gemmataceae bacterium]|jgi:fatty acid desaturase
MAMTMDLIGGSSYVWHWKHNIFHHTYANITDHDSDIDLGIFGRLSPHQRRYWFHRWQHLYLWPLYGLLTIHWHLVYYFFLQRYPAGPVTRPGRLPARACASMLVTCLAWIGS